MTIEIARNREVANTLKSVVNALGDNQKGMAEVGERLNNPMLRRYFLAESLRRANFRAELENELHRRGIHDVHETGTMAAGLHRAWAELKAKVANGDQAILGTAEQAEDEVQNAYNDALDRDLPPPIRQLLAGQRAHILNVRDYIHGLYSESKAA